MKMSLKRVGEDYLRARLQVVFFILHKLKGA